MSQDGSDVGRVRAACPPRGAPPGSPYGVRWHQRPARKGFLPPARSGNSRAGKRRVFTSTLLVKVEATPPRKRMLRCMKMSFGMAERHRKAPVVLRVEHDALPATPPPESYSGAGRGERSKRRRKVCVVAFVPIRDGDDFGRAARTARERRAGGDAPAISGVCSRADADGLPAVVHERLHSSMHSGDGMHQPRSRRT